MSAPVVEIRPATVDDAHGARAAPGRPRRGRGAGRPRSARGAGRERRALGRRHGPGSRTASWSACSASCRCRWSASPASRGCSDRAIVTRYGRPFLRRNRAYRARDAARVPGAAQRRRRAQHGLDPLARVAGLHARHAAADGRARPAFHPVRNECAMLIVEACPIADIDRGRRLPATGRRVCPRNR